MKKIVLFVEGEGDVSAVPILVKKALTELGAWDVVSLDENAFRVGSLEKLAKSDYDDWQRKLRAALKRPNVGGVLLLLDGDTKQKGREVFCAVKAAKALAEAARKVGAGKAFSVAVIFALREFETWLIAGYDSLKGKVLSDGRKMPIDVSLPDTDIEKAPRNAKGWFDGNMDGGYKPSTDQAALTELVELAVIRSRNLRSFGRFESALLQLTTAIRNSIHVATPT